MMRAGLRAAMLSATLALAGMAGAAIGAAPIDKAARAGPELTASRKQRVLGWDGFSPKGRGSRRTGPGWTHAQVQRMAVKRRNVQRSKRQRREAR